MNGRMEEGEKEEMNEKINVWMDEK